jgi:hypothetical protein
MPIFLQNINLHGTFTFLVVLGTGWLIYLVKNSLPAYLAEKGKNLATKEDVGHLTDIVERIRLQFSHVSTVHKIQFEAEFQAYRELAKSARCVDKAQIRLAFNYEDSVANFEAAHSDFKEVLNYSEPFIPEDVFKEFKVLESLVDVIKVDLLSGLRESPLDRSEERRGIDQARQQSVKAIKQRLASVLVV